MLDRSKTVTGLIFYENDKGQFENISRPIANLRAAILADIVEDGGSLTTYRRPPRHRHGHGLERHSGRVEPITDAEIYGLDEPPIDTVDPERLRGIHSARRCITSRSHDHGPACASDCPTCRGAPGRIGEDGLWRQQKQLRPDRVVPNHLDWRT